MGRRKIRDAREAHECVAQLEASGEALVDWARRHDIDGRSLHCWRMALRKRKAAPGLRLVELVSDAPVAPACSPRYVIRRGDFEVEVSGDFEQEALFKVLEVVAAC